MEWREAKKSAAAIAILMIAAVGFLVIFSLGTSFLYHHRYIGKDSEIFLAMGRFAKEGA